MPDTTLPEMLDEVRASIISPQQRHPVGFGIGGTGEPAGLLVESNAIHQSQAAVAAGQALDRMLAAHFLTDQCRNAGLRRDRLALTVEARWQNGFGLTHPELQPVEQHFPAALTPHVHLAVHPCLPANRESCEDTTLAHDSAGQTMSAALNTTAA